MTDTPADDLDALAIQVLTAAQDKSVMLVAAESCTGGLLAATLSDIPGCSGALDRAFVTYSNAAKEQMLGVGRQTLADHGAVSEEVAAEMASGALKRSEAGIAVSITGIAGPGGSDTKPEGRVCFGIADENGVRTETIEFGPLGRTQVRRAAAAHAMELMLTALG